MPSLKFAGFPGAFRVQEENRRRLEAQDKPQPSKSVKKAPATHPFDGPVDYLGRQVTVDFFDCDKGLLNDPVRIEKLMAAA